MASTCQRDIVGLWRKHVSEASALRATRLYVALFAVVTAILALRPPGSVVALTAMSGSLYAACFFPAIVFGLYWRRGDGRAVVASFLAGGLTLLLWRFSPLAATVHAVFPALLLSTLTYVGLAFAQTRPDFRFPAF